MRTVLRSPAPALALLVTALGLAACTSGSGPSPVPSTSVVTSTAPARTTSPTPISSGPTTAAAASTCPLAGTTFVRDTIGMRLGRITRLRSGGKVVGCRFYAFQDGPLHTSERLPGPNQPVVEITTQRYASSLDAHNAFVLRAGTSASVTRTGFGSVTGLCFQNDFDPHDKGADWACTVNKGPVQVLVRTVDTTQTTGAAAILTTALRAVST